MLILTCAFLAIEILPGFYYGFNSNTLINSCAIFSNSILECLLYNRANNKTAHNKVISTNYITATIKLATCAIELFYNINSNNIMCGMHVIMVTAAVASIYQTWVVKTNEYDYILSKLNLGNNQ